MVVDNPAGPVLEFLTFTSLPHRRDGDAQRIVRSHAIRDVYRRKQLGAGKAPKSVRGGGAASPPSQSSLTSKFKLNKKSAKPKEPAKDEEYRDQRLSHRDPEILFHPSLSIVIGAGIFDPFNTLGVELGPRQKALLDYQHSYLQQSAFTIGSKEGLFSLASTDPAWMNAVLCLISLHYDLQAGKGISTICLLHRSEALRIVNQRLIDSPQDVSEETIGAIASLANFDTATGSFQSASMHVQGLVEIVTNRGRSPDDGLLPFKNEFLQKVVAWSDLSYSTTWDLSPSLPLLTTGICRASISEYVLYFSQYFSPETEIYSPHDLVGEISDIFQAMRLLSLCVRSPPSDWWRRKVFDRGLYISEYKLLVVLDDQDDMGDEVVVPNRNSHIYGSCRLAAYLYLYIALREIPPSAATNQAIVKRLKGILESISVCLLTVWMEDRELFLWILYMGAVSALETAERAFFVKVLRKLIVPMGLDTMEAFTGTLKKVLWEPGFCEQDSTTRDLWEEIQRV